MNRRVFKTRGSQLAEHGRLAKPTKNAKPARVEPASQEDPALRLVLTAARLFNEDGIHAVGINRIVAEAGVARMTLYNQFGSKEGLVWAVMERESKAWFEWLDSELTRTAGEPAEARISAFFALLGQWFSRHDFKGCSFINAVGEHSLDSGVRPVAKAHRKANFEYIRRLIADGDVTNLDHLANQITILADGATVTAMVTGDASMASDAGDAAVALFSASVRAGTKGNQRRRFLCK